MPPSLTLGQRSHEPEIQNLVRWIKNERLNGCYSLRDQGRTTYIPRRELVAYFGDAGLQSLLLALCQDQNQNLLHDENRILKDYIAILAILVRIGNGEFISEFLRFHNMSDRFLPFYQRPSRFPSLPEHDFWDDFYRSQWLFCPHTFEQDQMGVSIDDNCVLPIEPQGQQGKGGFATIYKIQIDSQYDRLRSQVQGEEAVALQNLARNVYALKVFRKSGKSAYEAEVKSFQKLKNRTHASYIVKVFGSFDYRETHNIILEYADQGNLNQYFKRKSPRDPFEILGCWKAILNIIHAVWEIHNIPSKKEAEEEPSMIWHGFHRDITPDNILVFSKGSPSAHDVIFKLADLGYCHFRKHADSEGEATQRDRGGTREYGAPEVYRGKEMNLLDRDVNQKCDIWSIGCVLSEFAVYIADGEEGVSEYRRDRQSETSRIHTHQDQGCFHNTETVLDTVSRTHEKVQEGLRKHDHVTDMVIGQLVQPMLKHESQREDASTLWNRASLVLNQASETISSTYPQGQTFNEQDSLAFSKDDKHKSGTVPLTLGMGEPSHASRTHLRETSRSSHPRSLPLGTEVLRPYSPERPVKGNTSDSSKAFSPSTSTRSQNSPTISQNHARPNHSLKGKAISPKTIQFHEGDSESRDTQSPEGVGEQSQAARDTPDTSPRGSLQESSISTSISQTLQIRLAHAKPKKKLPYVSVEDARASREKRQQIGCENIVQELEKRDIVFIIDDAKSMKNHKPEIISLVRLMAHELKSCDANGMDLYFMVSSKSIKQKKDSTAIINHLRNHVFSGESNITQPLEGLLADYEAEIVNYNKRLRRYTSASGLNKKVWEKRLNPIKPLNIYILTNGKCALDHDASELIGSTTQFLHKYHHSRRQLGIEIIRFGDDQIARAKLKELDDLDQHTAIPLDIVDTTSATGNFVKMLVGASRDDYDAEISDSSPDADNVDPTKD